jgi:GNAT superfamily N-acetyltransferase
MNPESISGAELLAIRTSVTSADQETVRRLAASTGFFRPDEVGIAVELVQERLHRGESSGYSFLFAELAGQVVGYACYGLIGCTLGSYDLYWIVVDATRQRRGIGRRLIEEVEQRIAATGGRRVYIETSNRADYLPTREFYLRCGYRAEAILPNYYAEGDDKVIFAKQISPPG